jgi:hypothetical protein
MSDYVVYGYWDPGYAVGDVDWQSALERPVINEVYFAAFEFESSTLRFCTHSETVTWGGYEWIGLSRLGDISAIESSNGVDSKPMNFSLATTETSIVALALSPAAEYQGRAAYMYFAPLDDNYRLIGTPKLCWSGEMDNMTVGIDKSGRGAVIIKCENGAYAFKRRNSLRQNPTQLKSRYPNARGLDYLPDLIAKKYVWLSKLFQKI